MENKDAYGDSEKQILFAQRTRTINWTGAVVGKVTVTPLQNYVTSYFL
jgi:hypothetical protein